MTSTPDIHPPLTGTKVRLQAISIDDVTEEYLSWLQDDEVMQGIATSGYTIDSLKKYVSDRTGRKEVVFYTIRDRATGRHIGNVKLDFHDRRANVSELGLLIGNKDYWGKGIGYEACHLLLDYAFGTLGIRKVYLAVYASNPSARKLYEKLGFTLEGTLRKHVAVKNEYYDKYLMGIFSSEFK